MMSRSARALTIRALTVRRRQRLETVVGARSGHSRTRNRVLRPSQHITMSQRRGGITEEQQSRTSRVTSIRRDDQSGRHNLERESVHAHDHTSRKVYQSLATNRVNHKSVSNGDQSIGVLNNDRTNGVTVSSNRFLRHIDCGEGGAIRDCRQVQCQQDRL